jgi:ElaB/YqjD/DUF883 family membrane-anchored ribosome-binding protein
MTPNVEGATADIGADLVALRRDIAHLAEAMRGLVEAQTQAAGVRMSDAMGDARSKISHAAEDAQNNVRAASGEIEAAIDRNPLTAVLVALGVGMAIGLISRSRG